MIHRAQKTSWKGVALGCFLIFSLNCGRAHEFLTAYVQHRVEVAVGAKDIDVSLQLTFFEDGSEQERKNMDTNADGVVSQKEVATYLGELEPKLEEKLKLAVNGQPLRLMTLYPPELNLLGNDRVHRERHILTLHFFARTPAALKPGCELTVTDSLWPELRAIGLLHATAKDGCELEAGRAGSRAAEKDGPGLSFTARVTKSFAPTKGHPK